MQGETEMLVCLLPVPCVLGNLPPPRITALPGSTVPAKSPVTILCKGPKQAEGYRISRVGSPEPMDKEEQITPRTTNTLSFTEVATDKTGLYHCSYQRGGRWSQFSDPLQLVITGEGDTEAAETGLTPLPREGPGFGDRKQRGPSLVLGEVSGMMPRDFFKGEGGEEGRETRATSAPRGQKGTMPM